MARLSSTVPLLLVVIVFVLAVTTSPPFQAHASRHHQVADPPSSSSSSSVETTDKVSAGTDVLIIQTYKRDHVAEDGNSNRFSLPARAPSTAPASSPPEGGGLAGEVGGFFADLRRKFWRLDEPYYHVIPGIGDHS
jgi:hypothetical protein